MNARQFLRCGALAVALLEPSADLRAQDGAEPPSSAPSPGTPAPSQEPATPNAGAPSSSPPQVAPAPQETPATESGAGSQGAQVLEPIEIRQSKPRQARRTPPARPTIVASRPAPAAPAPQPSPQQIVTERSNAFDTARNQIFAVPGTSAAQLDRQAIEAMPQGANAPLDKLILQAPGVSQDSLASGSLHVRNEHGNLQYRLNGIVIPDGVSGFGQILDTGLIGNLSLITGVLPAQYGLRTSGVIDLQTRRNAFDNSGTLSVYGGSHGTFSTGLEYGGTYAGNCPTPNDPAFYVKTPISSVGGPCPGATQYYVMGRFLTNDVGLENPTSSYDAIHDVTRQGKAFGYASTILDETSRLSVIVGSSTNTYQIPNNPGQQTLSERGVFPGMTAFGIGTFDSAFLNENQRESTQYGVVAWQKSAENLDLQLAYFTRNSSLHFTPDPVGDLLFNGIASDIRRRSFVNGVQGDGSYRLNDSHTLRAGFAVSAERTAVSSSSLVEPLDALGNAIDSPFNIYESSSKVGWLLSGYVQDEWRLTDKLTLNTGLRFDQMYQFVEANQLSPRVNVVYKPFDGTTLHAGYARYFTPPVQVEATPVNVALYQNTTGAPPGQGISPMVPERADYFDVGIEQALWPGFKIGLDAYYKNATGLIDNGQFGAAYILTGFNYQRGENAGVELTANYTNGNFRAYGNIAVAQQIATNPISNQYLFDNTTPLPALGGLTELQYLQSHYVYTDHAEKVVASAGASYLWEGTRFSVDMIYGYGLRSGDANLNRVPPYTQVNVGASREFKLFSDKPTTIRFDVINLFDTIYEIRDGSGIGVFAPQFGPRRGYFVGVAQKF
jgi:outer membrane receptor protein involved in Fe transport